MTYSLLTSDILVQIIILALVPFLFYIYINTIITALEKADMGCHIDNIFVGCIAYADDILLLSAAVVHLHNMLEISQSQCDKLDIRFNPLLQVTISQAKFSLWLI